MIQFKLLEWGNFFSYGDNNKLNLEESPLSQLIGLNGVGKTSIPLILQEILYGKNVKKIIKSDLVNRFAEKGTYPWAVLYFEVNGIPYKLEYIRKGAKLSLTLLKDGTDISSHTTVETLKTIEHILALDFDTFTQLMYQSSKASLQFLTATDTQRKKFLIGLFTLEEYSEFHNKLKARATEIQQELDTAKGRLAVYTEWLNTVEVLPHKDLLKLPSNTNSLETLHTKLTDLKIQKSHIIKNNAIIQKNNTYKAQLASIDKELLSKPLKDTSLLEDLRKEHTISITLLAQKNTLIKKLRGKKDTCPTCGQHIDITDSITLLEKTEKEKQELVKEKQLLVVKISTLETEEEANRQIKKAREEFETLSNLIDEELQEELINNNHLDTQIKDIETEIEELETTTKKIIQENESIILHNAHVDSVLKQVDEYDEKQAIETANVNLLTERVSIVNTLKDAFGTNGIVSYKLEYLTKDLELVINEYLAELSAGRFQLTFKLKGDKLNTYITDQGDIVSINSLSEGELAKVTVSTLLAIRKLMQAISKTKLNILFLDEIMSVLDDFGREELINILLKEEALNTFLVTHAYRHPLVPTIQVYRQDGVSKIETV